MPCTYSEVAVPRLLLQKDRMRVLVGETHDFVLDARTVARPDAHDVPAVHRGAVQVVADDVVRVSGWYASASRAAAGAAASSVSFRNENGGQSSDGCASVASKSTVWRSMRGVVPVLKRPMRKPSRCSAADSPTLRASPCRPPCVCVVAAVHQAVQKRARRDHDRSAR